MRKATKGVYCALVPHLENGDNTDSLTHAFSPALNNTYWVLTTCQPLCTGQRNTMFAFKVLHHKNHRINENNRNTQKLSGLTSGNWCTENNLLEGFEFTGSRVVNTTQVFLCKNADLLLKIWLRIEISPKKGYFLFNLVVETLNQWILAETRLLQSWWW